MDSSVSLPALHKHAPKNSGHATACHGIAGSGSFQSHLSALHTQQRIHAVRPSGSLPAIALHAASHSKRTKEAFGSAPDDAIDCPPEHRTYAYSFASFARTHFGFVLPAPQNGAGAWHMSKMEAADAAQSSRLTRVRALPGSLKYLLYLYCCISLLVFSASVYWSNRSSPLVAPSHADVHEPGSSLLGSLSTASRLAKLSAIRPLPVAFEPLFFHSGLGSGQGAAPDSNAITACLWASEEELDVSLLHAWMQHWRGPISLVVTRSDAARSSRLSLSAKLSKLARTTDSFDRLRANSSAPAPAALSVHLLTLKNTPVAPNAFLNLARLFAPTEHVLLVPSIAMSPPRSFSLAAPPPLQPTVLAPGNSTALSGLSWTSPFGAGGKMHTPLPYPPLSPVLLPRAFPVWCTERFADFPIPSSAEGSGVARAADWDHCMFQLWLDAAGKLGVLHAPVSGQAVYKQKKFALTSAHVVQHRVGTRFRAETCVLALKRLEALALAATPVIRGRSEDRGAKKGKAGGRGVVAGDADIARARWLKRVCREWVNAS